MAPDRRRAKKLRAAAALHNVSPAEGLEMTAGLIEFVREIAEAADHAKL